MIEEIQSIIESRVSSQLLDIYYIYATVAISVTFWCVLVRSYFGASPAYLARTRCYELLPVRSIFHAIHIGTWLCFATALFLSLRYGWSYYETSDNEYKTVTLVAFGIMVLAGLTGSAVFLFVVQIPNNRPPAVQVHGVETAEGVDPTYLAKLGQEQFPEMLAYGHTLGLWVRGILMLGGFSCLAFTIVAFTDWGRTNGLYSTGIDGIRQVKEILPLVPYHWAIVGEVSAVLGMLLLLFFNHTYTLVRFPQTLLAAGALAVVGWSCAALLDTSDEHLGLIAGGIGLALAVRWGHDLSRAARFTKVTNVSQPIADRIGDQVPYLNTMKSRPDCQLTPLDNVELRERISHGCRNLEEASPLVTRNVARFLSLVRIEYEHFVAAMLRYLTVRRFITTSSGGGTHRMLQHPVVPVWNENLFPLRPPSGFINWLDPLGLSSEWDIVSICSSCGGSGRVSCSGCGGSGHQQRSETYTEYSGGQSVNRTRNYQITCPSCSGSGRVTCTPCSGCGRVVYHQTLNTQWQRLLPTYTTPRVRIPSFMEDAEERTYFRLPLVENRAPLAVRSKHDGIKPDLEAKLSRVVPGLSPDMQKFASSVEKLHDGVIYRADFQVTGYWVLRISYQRLPGHVGWFFGRRPELYFPILPISWSTISTVLFVLPFLILTALLVVAFVIDWLRSTLPPLP